MNEQDTTVGNYIKRAWALILSGQTEQSTENLKPHLIEIAKMIQIEDMRVDELNRKRK